MEQIPPWDLLRSSIFRRNKSKGAPTAVHTIPRFIRYSNVSNNHTETMINFEETLHCMIIIIASMILNFAKLNIKKNV